MRTFGLREIRNALGHLKVLLNTTDEIILTKYGKEIARILPMKGKQCRPTHTELHRLTKRLSIPSEQILRKERGE